MDNDLSKLTNKEKPEKDYILYKPQFSIIQNRIYSLIEIENILNIVNPKLKDLYILRSTSEMESKNKSFSETLPYLSLFRITKDKLNNEEKMLLSFLSPKNLIEDLPELLSYISLIYSKIHIVNKSNQDYLSGHSNEILSFVIKEATEKYFASKLSVYITNEEEDDYKVEELSVEETKKTMDEVLSHPLFMTEIPKDIEDNMYLKGIQAIKYDEEAEEIGKEALNLSKEKFEKYKKMKQFKYLKESMYEVSNAIDHCCNDSEVSGLVKRKLYIQRSDLNIHVKNWMYAIEDLEKALELSVSSSDNENLDNDIGIRYISDIVKNIIFCYVNINSYIKAETFLISLLTKLPSSFKAEYKQIFNEEILSLHRLKSEHQTQLEKIEVLKQFKSNEQQIIYEELSLKGIKLKPQYHKVPGNCVASIYKDENGLFHYPLLIIYEEFNMTDYVQDCIETMTITEIIDMLFSEKLPWDKEGLYTKLSVRVYYEMNMKDYNLTSLTTSYYPLKNEESILNVISRPGVYLNGFPVLSIVSCNSKYFEYFIKNKIVLKRK